MQPYKKPQKHQLIYKKLEDLDLLDVWIQTGGNYDYLIEEGFLTQSDIQEIDTDIINENIEGKHSSSSFNFALILTFILALFSLGICIQGNKVAQALRDIARNSVHQIITQK